MPVLRGWRAHFHLLPRSNSKHSNFSSTSLFIHYELPGEHLLSYAAHVWHRSQNNGFIVWDCKAVENAPTATDKAAQYSESAKQTASQGVDSAKETAAQAQQQAGQAVEAGKQQASETAQAAQQEAATLTSKIGDYIEGGKANVAGAVETVKQTAASAIGFGQQKAEEATAAAGDAANAAKQKGAEAADVASTKASQAQDVTAKKVESVADTTSAKVRASSSSALHCTATQRAHSLCVMLVLDLNNRPRRHRRLKSSSRIALGLRSIVYSRSSRKAAVQAVEFWCTEQQKHITMSYQ
eukprot:6534-Heterococcus_DN1.PRE.1